MDSKLGWRPRKPQAQEPMAEVCGKRAAWVRGEMNVPGAPRSPLTRNSSARGGERVVGGADAPRAPSCKSGAHTLQAEEQGPQADG